MNKRDLTILSLLVMLLLLWPIVGPQIDRQLFPPSEAPPVPERAGEGDLPAPEDAGPAVTAAPGEAGPVLVEAAAPELLEPVVEERVILSNDVLRVTFSSVGASVVHAWMEEYREQRVDDGSVVELDFAERPALTYQGLGGLDDQRAFRTEADPDARRVVFQAETPAGLDLTRTITLDDSYRLRVVDVFSNRADRVVILPEHDMRLGRMSESTGGDSRYSMYYMGVDALLQGGEGVEYLGKKLIPKALKNAGLLEMRNPLGKPVEWVAVKNRFFVQILAPENGGNDCLWEASREHAKSKGLQSVAAAVRLPSFQLEPEQAVLRETHYYIGPKKFSVLHQYGRAQVDVMDFGMFAPICKFLLWVLNLIHDKLWPYNYGVAIMLLTIIIRILFWPITHKGTESMRRMQEIQPLMKEIQGKYKDNPQKQQQEMFALYKKHKVNPVGGCLPMVIQIPVFFALFVVLRSAIELRYAEFLWIRDLSEPEHLFAELLPFGGLNILPVVMSVSMIWQQKLMPTTGDPRQAKMMQFMPVIMLFVFYGFASGLVLYWTTNQFLMIFQQLLYQRRKARKAAVAPA
jgi:YidC/Oxa1 family membrane protein insertase